MSFCVKPSLNVPFYLLSTDPSVIIVTMTRNLTELITEIEELVQFLLILTIQTTEAHRQGLTAGLFTNAHELQLHAASHHQKVRWAYD